MKPKFNHEVLRTMLEDSGLRRDWVAEQIGVKKGTLDRYCIGVNSPKLPVLMLMAQVFNCEVDDFFTESEAA